MNRRYHNLSTHPTLGMALLSVALFVTIAPAGEGPSLSSLLKPIVRPQGAPTQGDIALSSRWPRPTGPRDLHDSFVALNNFHATRIDWCYTGTNREFVQRGRQAGVPIFGTISAELTDAPDKKTRLLGRDKALSGDVVPNPELPFVVARGDVASDAFREVVMVHCRAMLDAGVVGIQVDDPGMTYHGAIYAQGGYGDASVAQFMTYLHSHSTSTDRDAWGLPEALKGFDYRAYAEAKGTALPTPLKEHFLAFHHDSLDDFYRWLRRALDDHAGRRVPLSCNNGSNQRQDEIPYVAHFDFWVGETGLAYGDPTAKGIFGKALSAQTLGKVQVFSPPNDGLDRLPTREGYIELTRKLIATSYACGSPTLVPWDVWRRGPVAPRLFGTLEEFGDLYTLIHENRDVLDGYELAYAAGPDMEPWYVDGLDEAPVTVPEGVFVAVRALPGKPDAPVVLHLVDWREGGGPLSLSLSPRLTTPENTLQFLAPGTPSIPVVAHVNVSGEAVIQLPPIKPCALLRVVPPVA